MGRGWAVSRGHPCGEGELSFRRLHCQLGTWCVVKLKEYIKFKSECKNDVVLVPDGLGFWWAKARTYKPFIQLGKCLMNCKD